MFTHHESALGQNNTMTFVDFPNHVCFLLTMFKSKSGFLFDSLGQ